MEQHLWGMGEGERESGQREYKVAEEDKAASSMKTLAVASVGGTRPHPQLFVQSTLSSGLVGWWFLPVSILLVRAGT